MPQGIKLLKHQKYAKMLCQSSNVPFAQPNAHQKTAALVLFVSVETSFFTDLSTKPLRLRFGTANCSDVQLFFDFFRHLGLTAFFGKTCIKQKSAPTLSQKRCVHTIGLIGTE